MTTIERVGEGLVRRTNRRRFLRRAAAGIFGVTAAWATQGFGFQRSLAHHCTFIDSGSCYCRPPNGTFCTTIGTDAAHNCVGANCYTTRDANGVRHCYVDTSPYSTGCWCTTTCDYGGVCGYYECCDCFCHGINCGCRRFVNTYSYPACAQAPAAGAGE